MAASAARQRFHRDFDADVVGPRLRSFLLGQALPITEQAAVHGRG
jgi:hypothetical protein